MVSCTNQFTFLIALHRTRHEKYYTYSLYVYFNRYNKNAQWEFMKWEFLDDFHDGDIVTTYEIIK